MSYKTMRQTYWNADPGVPILIEGNAKQLQDSLYKIQRRAKKEKREFQTRIVSDNKLEVIRVDNLVTVIIDTSKFEGLKKDQTRVFGCGTKELKRVKPILEAMGFKVQRRSSSRWEAIKL